jgi:IMP dehydrogenase/GMP reductase
MKKALTFDDVALVPQFNNVPSRTEPSLSTWLTTKTKIKIPILAANMDTVIGKGLANVLIDNGTFPIFHRFAKHEELISLAKEFNESCYMSIGMNEQESLLEHYSKSGVRGVCIDIAHGHDSRMLDLVRHLKSKYKFEVIAGNVCTAGGYIDLVNAGADAVKVGIGPGAACTTRMVTGFGVPQFTAIENCAQEAKKYGVPIIADGGIRGSADIAKSLAAGATCVMMGKIFALTLESAAEKREVYSGGSFVKFEAKYRGQASKDFQKDFKGGLKKGTVAEGECFWGEVTDSAQEVIDELTGGLRSAFTYAGARHVDEFQRKIQYVEVSNTYQMESNIRK